MKVICLHTKTYPHTNEFKGMQQPLRGDVVTAVSIQTEPGPERKTDPKG